MLPKALLLALLLSTTRLGGASPSLPTLSELDPAGWFSLVRDANDASAEPVDTLVLFYHGDGASAAPAIAAVEAAAARLLGTALRVALYDAHRWGGAPSGVHLHAQPLLLLGRAGRGGEEPPIYDWEHDEASYSGRDGGGGGGGGGDAGEGGGSGGHAHGHAAPPSSSCAADGHAHEHEHASSSCAANAHDEGDGHGHHHHHHHGDARLSSAGVLAFLRRHSTFAAEVPAPRAGDAWRGRETGLWRAVASGLDALRARMEELEAENAALRARLQGCGIGEL